MTTKTEKAIAKREEATRKQQAEKAAAAKPKKAKGAG